MKTIKLLVGVALATSLLAGCEQSDLKTTPGENVDNEVGEEQVTGWAEPDDILYKDSNGFENDLVRFGGFVSDDRISLSVYKDGGYSPVYYKAKAGHEISMPSQNIVIEILEMKPDEDAIKVKVSKEKIGE